MAENNNNEGSEIPSQFSHSVKLEQTAKGVRITVHVSADNGITARQEAIDMYIATQAELRDRGIEIAPRRGQNMIIGLVVAILLLLLSATTTLAANASSKLPLTCDESSDDKVCANFQIHSESKSRRTT